MRSLRYLLGVVALACLVTALASAGSTAVASPAQLQVATVSKGAKLHPGVVLTAPKKVRGRAVKHYQWERCNTKGKSCKKIKGATRRTYRLTRKDVGHRLRSVETTGQGTTATSVATIVVGPPLAVNTSLPTISDAHPAIAGQVTTGDSLTGSLGTWTGALSYEWSWEDCDSAGANCTTIAGSSGGPVSTTTSTYTVQSSDVGHTIRLVVTAFNTVQT